MKATTENVRGGFIGALYAIYTLILLFNIPEAGEKFAGFGMFAGMWMLVTLFGGFFFLVAAWNAVWSRAPYIAAWINEKLNG